MYSVWSYAMCWRTDTLYWEFTIYT